MAIKIVRNGTELDIRPALDYLERMYGIPAGHMKAVAVDGEVGAPMLITVTVYAMREESQEPMESTDERRYQDDLQDSLDRMAGAAHGASVEDVAGPARSGEWSVSHADSDATWGER